MLHYLETAIVESRRTEQPRYGSTSLGYTLRAGGPTGFLVRLAGEARWRRLMVRQFSNAGTCFLRIRGVEYIVRDYDLPEPTE